MTHFDQLTARTASARAQLQATPVIGRALRGDVTRELYVDFLTQAYHHVRHTVPLLMAVATRIGWRCFALTALTAPWPFATLVSASRRVEPRHPGLTGAALGSVAGAWAAVMVELWCPLAVHSHALVGHVLPLFALALAGAAIDARMFRMRRV